MGNESGYILKNVRGRLEVSGLPLSAEYEETNGFPELVFYKEGIEFDRFFIWPDEAHRFLVCMNHYLIGLTKGMELQGL